MEKKPQRFMNLEGLRGVAAIVVVLYHAMTMFYPGIAYGVGSAAAPVQHMRFEDNLYGNPLNVFLSGGFAVGIFFILSGFVLSIGFFQTGKESIVKKLASKRYLRLMLPALASVLLSFALLSLHFNGFREAAVAITHSGTPGEWSFSPSILPALSQGTFNIFFNGEVYYNPVLWTMMYEFIGSFIVFGFLLVFGKAKYRWLLYAVLALVTFNTWYFGFILGSLLADLYAHGLAPFREKDRKFALSALIIGLLLGGFPFGSPEGTPYGYLPQLTTAFYISAGAALVVVAILSLPRLSKFFASPRISVLGRYTYSLYLTHYLVLLTLCTTLFVFFSHWLGYNKAALVSVVAIAPVVVAVTWLFERYVDSSAIRFASYVSDVLNGKREFAFGQKVRAQVTAFRERLSPVSEIDEE